MDSKPLSKIDYLDSKDDASTIEYCQLFPSNCNDGFVGLYSLLLSSTSLMSKSTQLFPLF